MSKKEIVLVLPDIRSTHNTGSLFRTADGAGVSKIYLCGITAPPPHPHLMKVSLGAEETVPWEYSENVYVVLQFLQENGFQVVAAEQTRNSVDYRGAQFGEKVALVLGNEVDGLSKELLNHVDLIIDLPMHGSKESLNVSVAGGIILYYLRAQQ